MCSLPWELHGGAGGLGASCSVLVWSEELPFRPWEFVVMNGDEGAPYKPNSVAETFHCGKPQLNPTMEQLYLSW